MLRKNTTNGQQAELHLYLLRWRYTWHSLINYLPIDKLQGFKEAVFILCQKHLWHRNATRKHFGGSCQIEFSSTVAVPSRSSSAKSQKNSRFPSARCLWSDGCFARLCWVCWVTACAFYPHRNHSRGLINCLAQQPQLISGQFYLLDQCDVYLTENWVVDSSLVDWNPCCNQAVNLREVDVLLWHFYLMIYGWATHC